MTPREQANRAVVDLEEAIVGLLGQHPEGLGNVVIAKELGLFSPPGTAQRNRVSWWILSRLEEAGRVTKSNGPRPIYKVV